MLDELVDVFETLKARINEYRTVLQGNEAQTRLSLIDPLLRALGWDTADPARVRPEYNLSGGRADYALLDGAHNPVAIVEAKKLDEQLGTMDRRMQMLTYANFSNVPYAGLTDGSQWVFYKVFDQKPLEDRLVLDVSIASLQSHQSALQFLLLWYPNMASRDPVEANEPFLEPEPAAPVGDTPTEAAVAITPGSGWIALEKFVAAKGGQAPSKVKFPSGNEKNTGNWRRLIIQVAEWLVEEGVLTPDKCPVPTDNRHDYNAIDLQPKHPRGNDFFRPHILSNGLFLSPTGPATSVVRRCKAIIEHCGRDPAKVYIQVG